MATRPQSIQTGISAKEVVLSFIEALNDNDFEAASSDAGIVSLKVIFDPFPLLKLVIRSSAHYRSLCVVIRAVYHRLSYSAIP